MPKLKKPSQKQKDFANAYCNEAKGSVAKAYEMIANIGPSKIRQRDSNPKSYRTYLSNMGYRMLNHPMTLKAIEDVKESKNKAFWLAEEDILAGLYTEATITGDKSTQAARIQAWVWLGKHIGMFGESSKSRGLISAEANNRGPTYQIINYNSSPPPPPPSSSTVPPSQTINKEEDIVKGLREALDGETLEAVKGDGLFEVKDFSQDE